MPETATLSSHEYRVLVEQAPIMIWRAGLDTLCDYFNERWLAFTGRTMEQETGNGWTEGVHREDFDACVATYLDSFKARRPFEMEYRLKRADGAFRWILDRGVPIFHDDGAFAGYTGSCIDITETVVAREKMKAMRDTEVEALRGMLPICSWCKQVRNDSGYWESVESYIHSHASLDFSHGMCPECETRFIKENQLGD
jgi:PAS domain S-box-containing protein